MNRSWMKKIFGQRYSFTDFKHHHESWRNSKKLRARRERRKLKEVLRGQSDD